MLDVIFTKIAFKVTSESHMKKIVEEKISYFWCGVKKMMRNPDIQNKMKCFEQQKMI
jgi:hypothetical protein